MSSSAASTEHPVSKPASTGRLPLPSLNQIAAHMNPSSTSGSAATGTLTPSSAPAATGTSQSTRPRLAAYALRTGSSTSLSTTASTNDSIAVNAPTTRSTSPTNLSTSPPRSTTPSSSIETRGEPLTSEKLEKLNQESSASAGQSTVNDKKNSVPVGYKNIPSLDAITARLANVKARGLSVDGSLKPPDAEMIEDPKTPGVPMKAPEHPLQYTWTIYHDTKAKYPYTSASSVASQTPSSADPPHSAHAPESTDYEAGLTIIGEFDTVESFCRYFNWLKPPSKLTPNSNYHLFKSGIKPMWEDAANANGGKWVLTMRNNPQLLDRCWSWLAMALVGEELEEGGDEICGAVVSLRSKVDRIQVWTRSKEDVEKLNGIGRKLVKLLDVSEADGIGLEFQYNTDDRPLPNKFLSIQTLPQTSYRSSFQTGNTPTSSVHSTHSRGNSGTFNVNHNANPNGPTDSYQQSTGAGLPAGGAGAFGGFGIGIGPAGQGPPTWRSGKRG